MNILQLLAELAEANPAVYEQASQRRAILGRLGSMGAKVAATSLPLAAGSLLFATPAQARSTPLDVLQFALVLEHLENDFYRTALGLLAKADGTKVPAGFIPADVRPDFVTIQEHEQQHVDFLTKAITSSGGVPAAKPTFDYTGSHNGSQSALFPDVFTNLDTFLAVAQFLEDAGVRAYKGQVTALQSDNGILEAGVRIHSVEARHASHIRTLRRQRQAAGAPDAIRSCVGPGASGSPLPGKTDLAYAGEDQLTQPISNLSKVTFSELTTLAPVFGTDSARLQRAVQEAFDEPVTTEQASAIVAIFTY
ncbi:ferritin-like domain-containing protein [Hymenobacter sp. DG25B]|uniref:ferritin-like domain-containing protein n=1 Tax=Hymenobacter sp. DG25B TaxID=1385664 RepID=UPI000B241CAD|nr:ferritin-like domain-containing protein [Hymenobacter sp. DG25B]